MPAKRVVREQNSEQNNVPYLYILSTTHPFQQRHYGLTTFALAIKKNKP